MLKGRVRRDFDVHVVADGMRGMGKSAMLYQLAVACDSGYDMERDMFYTKDQLDKIYDGNRPYAAAVGDEAMNLLYRREAMGRDVRELNKKLEMSRKFNRILLWALPSFWSLDSHFRTSMVHMRFFVHDRGRASIFVPKRGVEYAHFDDPWLLKLNLKKFTGPGKWERSPNYFGELLFGDWPEGVKDRYLEISKKRREASEVSNPFERELKKSKRLGRFEVAYD